MAAECCSTDHVGVLLPKIKKIPKNTNGRLAIPALAGLRVTYIWLHCVLSTLRPARCYQQGADGTDHGLTSCYTYRHRRRSREGPQVWTLTIMLWGSAMAWTLTIIWLHYRICSFLMFQTVHLECHQQRSFTPKMHQNRWRQGLRPRPHWGSLQFSAARVHNSIAVFEKILFSTSTNSALKVWT